jgi:hypothetical protein
MADDLDRLVHVVAEELSAQFAVGRFGENQPMPDARLIFSAAELIADAVNDVFRLEARGKPDSELSLDQSSTDTDAARG